MNENIIDKHRTVRNETIIPDTDSFTDERVGLNSAAPANRDVFLNFNKWPDKRIVSDQATVEIDRLHHLHILTELHIDNSDGAKFRRCHKLSTTVRSG